MSTVAVGLTPRPAVASARSFGTASHDLHGPCRMSVRASTSAKLDGSVLLMHAVSASTPLASLTFGTRVKHETSLPATTKAAMISQRGVPIAAIHSSSLHSPNDASALTTARRVRDTATMSELLSSTPSNTWIARRAHGCEGPNTH